MSSPSTTASHRSFDILMTVLGLWFTGGVFLDGWAHNHLDSTLETFFTPWHAVLYSGYLVCALALLHAWKRHTLPPAYRPSLYGAAIFAVGGVTDMAWHLTFGIEKDIEALLSPTHLLLVAGAALILSGPFRSAWQRPGGIGTHFRDWLPAALSLTFTVSVLSFITQFAHPVRITAAGARPQDLLVDWMQARGIAGFLLQTSVLAGAALLAVKRWDKKLPYGFFTLFLGLNAFAMALMTYAFHAAWAALAAGLLLDLCAKRCGLRLFAFLVPALYMLCYFIALMLHGPLWWSVHLWTGSIVMSGACGLLLSYLIAPPAMPSDA